jgi:pentatricopeptide repeat protein
MQKMMELDYIKLDCILLNTLLDGCEKCNCYDEALDIFYLFKKKNVAINMMTYALLLKILGVKKIIYIQWAMNIHLFTKLNLYR